MATFGNRLKLLRTEKKLTQKELGDLFQISESSIGMYERGEREPSFDLLFRLSSYFEVPIDYMVGYSNHRKRVTYDTSKKTLKEIIKEGNIQWDKGMYIPENTPQKDIDFLLDLFETGLKKVLDDKNE